MTKKFIFFDTETSGIDKYFGQIFQFAAILTDENFVVLDQFDIRSRRMPHIVPDPGAMLVTGVSPEQLEVSEYSYYEFSSFIRKKLLEWSPAIFCGYNSLNFDEPYMRSMFYQNLYDPYLSQTNGNKRIDILPIVWAAEHLFPKALKFSLNEKGKTSKKLEHVALANGFNNHNAHDAMGDVLATLHIAKILKSKVSLLWKNAISTSSRFDFNKFISNDPWVLVHDNNNGWPVTYPGVEITKIDNGRNSLFFDLRYPLQKITCNDLKKNFTGRDRPFRVIKSSNMPIVFKRNELKKIEKYENIDCVYLDSLSKEIKKSELVKKATHFYNQSKKTFDKSEYIEGQIYDNFDAYDNDKFLIEKFHNSLPIEKLSIAGQFRDKRFRSFARRIIFENFQASMRQDEINKLKMCIKKRINSDFEVPWTTADKAINECNNLLAKINLPYGDILKIKEYILKLKSK